MKKRIVSFLIVLSMLTSTVFAMTPMKKIKYVAPYLTKLERIAERVEKEIQREDNFETLLELYDEMQAEFEHIYTMCSVVAIKQRQMVTSEYYAKEFVRSTEVCTAAHEMIREMLVSMVSSQYESQFRELWGSSTVDALLTVEELDEEKQALHSAIAQKRERYHTLLLKPVATIDGVQYHWDEVSDIKLRERIFNQWSRELGQIYIDIVNLSKKLDPNYYISAYQDFNRSYTPVDASVFEEAVAESFAKVYGKIQNSASLKRSEVVWDGTMEELFEIASQGFSAIDESLVESYKLMKENELFDVEYRETKENAGNTTVLPSFESVFLYLQPNDPITSLSTFYHEFGHFNQLRQEEMHVYWPGESIDLDAAEVASQALSLLMSDRVYEIFGEGVGERYTKETLRSTLMTIPSACAVDAFEQFAFSTDNLTYEALCEKFGELCEVYNLPWTDQTWPQIHHIYDSPGYYISYAVSATSALELWMEYGEDEARGVEMYLDAVAAYDLGYLGVLREANLRNPFYSPDLISEISTSAEKTFGVLVDTYGHWAEESIDLFARSGLVSGYVSADGRSYFKPEQKITRAEFVKFLYGICSNEELVEVASEFSDVSKDAWYAGYIAWAVREGLVQGVSETEFQPDATITRQDMAVMLHRYLAWSSKNVQPDGEMTVADHAAVSAYAREAVDTLLCAKILKGFPNGTFAPNETVTRAVAITAICGAYDYVGVSAEVSE